MFMAMIHLSVKIIWSRIVLNATFTDSPGIRIFVIMGLMFSSGIGEREKMEFLLKFIMFWLSVSFLGIVDSPFLFILLCCIKCPEIRS